jgi:hypothetical protein
MDTERSSRSLSQRLRARPVLTGGLGVTMLAILGVAVVWFEPQALFIDDVVDEAFPTAEPSGVAAAGDAGNAEADDPAEVAQEGEAAAEAEEAEAAATVDEASGSDADAEDGVDAPAPEEPAGPLALATGSFEGRNDYEVTGAATFYELPDGSRTLRLENFVSDNGPDLYVYLTSSDSSATDAVIDEDVVDLGVLTGNIGNQNYAIPDDVDLDRYDTVLIWCLRFTAGFGAADLLPPRS